MKNSYGFQYEHDGKRYAFDLEASTQLDAEERLKSMAASSCLGRLVLQPQLSKN